MDNNNGNDDLFVVIDEESDGEAVTPPPKVPISHIIVEWVEVFCYAFGLMIIIFLFLFKYVTVDGSSMNTTLINEDRLVISNFMYTPKSGDIIVVCAPSHNKPLIKRIIATEGQKVKINFETWEVFVNGKKLEQSYLDFSARDRGEWMRQGDQSGQTWEFTVEDDKVFVMGDNRQNSEDSRFNRVGQLPNDYILGKVIIRVYPEIETVK